MRINRSIATVGLLATGWMAFAQVRINSRTNLNYATQNASYNDQLYAGGGTAPYTFTADPAKLPPGVTLSANGLLSGTPTSSQQFSFDVTATDANNQAAKSTFFMNVCNAPWAITGNTTLPDGYVGQLYTPPAALFNVGPVCNVASEFLEFPFFTLVSGKMPPGLRLPYTGMPPGLYGTPTTAGTYNFTVRASEFIPNGRSATQQFKVTIHPPQQLAIKTFDLPQTLINSDFAFQLGATGGFVPYTWAVQPGSALPPGLTLTAGGSLEGQPLQTGDYSFTLGVTDSHGTNLTYGYLLSVTNNSNGPMIVTNSLLPAGYTNVAYSKQLGLAGTGGTPAVWSIVAGALPTGVQIDTNTGLLSGTVTAPAGAYNFTIQASAGELGQATQNATINVFAQPLTFDIPLNYLPGVEYPNFINFTDGPSPSGFTLDLLSGPLPPGVTIIGLTSYLVNPLYIVDGTANPSSPTTYNGTLRVRTNDGRVATFDFSILATPPTVMNSGSLPGGTLRNMILGADYGGYLSDISGGDSNYPNYFSVTSGSLPPGITLESDDQNFTVYPTDSILSGTPTATGTYNFTVTVTDPIGGTTSAPYQITVLPYLNIPLQLGPATLPIGTAGASYSAQLTATNGGAPYTYVLTNNTTLPPGLGLSPSGLISGTLNANDSGTYNFQVLGTDNTHPLDGGPLTATQSYSITVQAGPLQLSPSTLPDATQLATYTIVLSAMGGVPPYTFAAQGLPPGITLPPNSNTISGVCTGTGLAQVTLSVTDAANQSVSEGPLPVGCNPTPVITNANPLPNGAINVPYSVGFVTNALYHPPGAAPFTWALNLTQGSLSGLLFNTATGVLSGTPTATGTTGFNITFTDRWGATTTKGFTYTIYPKLVITTTSLPSGQAGVVYPNTPLAVTGGTGSGTYVFSATGLPPGLNIDASSGVISGMPTQGGNFTPAFKVTDNSGQTATKTIPLTIAPAAPIVITTPKVLPTGDSGHAYSHQIQWTGGVPSYTVTGTGLPAWLSIDNNGNLMGMPPLPGTFQFSVTVKDSENPPETATKSFSLVVNGPSITSTSPLPPATVGIPYSFTFTASGGAPAYTWTATGLPNWLALTNAGVLNGTPPANSPPTITFTVTVTDSHGDFSSGSFVLPVTGSPLLFLTTSPLTAATAGVSYNTTFSSTGGTPPYTFTAANLPNWLTLNPDGALTGTPPAAGPVTFTVTVSDNAENSTSQLFTLPVNSVLNIGTISPLSPATVGASYTSTLLASGGTGVYTWSATGLPNWLTLSASGVLTGTPTATGSFSFNVTVQDSANATASRLFTLQADQTLIITTPTTLPPATGGLGYLTTFAAAGGIGPYSWSATGLPNGLTLTPTGVLMGTYPTGNQFSFQVTVADSANHSANGTFSLTVNQSLIIGTTSPLPSATIGFLYNANFTASGGSGGYTWSATGLPPWLTFTEAGFLTGVPPPSATQVSLTVTVKDQANNTTPGTFVVPVNPALAITNTSPLPPGTIGSPYSLQFAATGGAGNYSWLATGLPVWLTLSPTGLLSGTPPNGNAVSFTVDVIDAQDNETAKNFTLPVNAGLVITTSSPLPPASVGVPYSDQFTATGGSGGYVWSATGLPQWLSMSPAGVLSGTPPVGASNVTFNVTVKDSQNESTSGTFTLPVNRPLMIITTSPLPPATIGVPYKTLIVSSGGTGGNTWTATGLPSWLTLTPGTNGAFLTGTPPPGATSVTFTITVTDQTNDTVSKPFLLPINSPLVITTTSPLPAATIGVPYSDQFTATGGSGGYTWSATGLPQWLTMSPAGVLSGTPPPGAVAVTFNVAVKDSQNDSVSGSFTLPVNSALVITTTSPLPAATIGFAYSDQFTATGGSGGYTWSATGLPQWLTMSPAGVLSGTPPPGAVAVNFSVTVKDSQNDSANGTFTLPVNPALVITTTSPLPPATIGAAYSDQFTASGGSGGYTWSATGLPQWLTMSPAGVLSGTPPPGAVAVTFNVTVKDSQNDSASGSFTLPVNPALVITTTSPLPAATIGVAYSDQFSATGGSGGYIWSATGLPQWLTMSPAGVLSGTPPQGATAVTFNATVTDSENDKTSGTFTLPINPAGSLTITTTSPLSPATIEIPYGQQFAATGGSGSGYNWTATGLPAWLSITQGGLLFGTPPLGATSVTFGVTVTDSQNHNATGTFTLPVNPAGTLTITTTSPLSAATITEPYSAQFTATGGSKTGYSWVATGLPVWLTMSTSGLLSGTPPPGATAVTFDVTVMDSQNNSATGTFTLPVNQPGALTILTTSPLPPGTLGVAYAEQFSATGGSGSGYVWTASGLPGWLTMTTGGLLSGTPPPGATSVTFTATVTDSANNPSSGTFTLPLNPAGTLTITTTSPLPPATVEVAYSQQFAATGGSNSGYTWTATGLPSWLTMTSGGLLSGTPPPGATAVTFDVTVTDSQNNTANGIFTLPVNPGTKLIITTTSPLPPATIGVAYSDQFAATGGSGVYTWTATGLPVWLTMSAGGLLTGTPPVGAAAVTFNVTVTDTQENAVTGTFTLPVNPALVITTTSPLPAATIGVTYSDQFAATGGSGGYTWTATGLPAWLTMTAGGLLVGTPPQGATGVTFNVTVKDSQSNSANGTFTLPVNPAGTLTITTTSPLPAAFIAVAYAEQFAAIGGSGGYSWSATGLPAWLTMSTGGLLSGTPPFGATAVIFNVTVKDSQNNTASGTFTLPVNEAGVLTILTTSPLPPATIGVYYAEQFAATGGSGGNKWTATGLPSWLTMSTGGLLSGTPPVGATTVSFNVTVTDSQLDAASGTFTLPVNAAGTLTITTTSPLSPATIEIPYSQQFAATGGSGSGYNWTATGLPAWLSITPGGLLFGTPPVGAAAVTFDVTVTDSQNNISSGTFTLPVNPAGTLTITTTSPLSPATIGATYSAQFTATGGSGSGYSWIATGLPAWLTMTSGGLLSGIPPPGATAVTFNVTVTDSQNNSASGTFTLPVNPAATLTIVTTSPLPPATLGVAYADQFAATGGSGSGYVWSASGLPAWLTMTSGGLLSGTPPPGATAVTFTATVTDSANHTANGTFALPVNPAGTLTITTTSPLPAATIGVAYSDQFAATGGSGSGYTWTATGLPSWLTMTAAGLLSGTPPQGATAVTFDVTVTDSQNNTANGVFTLPVNPEATLTITTTSPLPAATVGVPYSDQFAATGGSGSGYTWTATGLPGWLTMSPGGLLSGTPPVGATSVTFNVTVTDSQNNMASGSFTLPVNPVIPVLTITTTSPLPAATVGVAYSDQFAAMGGSGVYTWTATGLPSWLTLTTSGLLVGTPPQGATAATFDVTVKDSQNNMASGTFTLPVNPAGTLTIITTSPLSPAFIGSTYSQQFDATGGSNAGYSWSASGLPAWLTMSAGGLLIGTPPLGAVAVTFEVTVKDSQNNSASGTFILPVNEAGVLTITTTSPLTPATIGVAYSQQFAATSGSGTGYSWTAAGLPGWLTMTTAGLLTGTPPQGAATVTFDVTVTDSQKNTASGTFTLPVNPAGTLTITTTSPLTPATVGAAYSQQFAATGGSGTGYTWSATGLPVWLTMSAGGSLSGTPPQGAAAVTFTVTIRDSQNNTASGTFTLPVNAAGTLAITTTSPLTAATIGVAYSQQFAATGGSGSGYTWTATSLPSWLSMSAGGLLAGTPPLGATAVTFNVTVKDSQNNTASGAFTLPVNPASTLTITTTSPLPAAKIGVAYSDQFTATGGSGSYTWTATGLPSWLSMSAGGLLTGTPPVGATAVTFNVTVKDSQNNTASGTFILPVNPASTLTITTTSPLPPATLGIAYSDQFAATGGSGSGYTWTATGLPAWLSMSAGGLLTGTPPQGATAVTFNVTVTDSQNNTASGAFTLPVNPTSTLTITTTSPLPTATLSVQYSDTLTATGGSGGYVWTSTNLPTWLNLSTGGVLTGTPTVAGPYTFTVTVTDSKQATASKTLTIEVSSGVALHFTTQTLGNCAVGIPCSDVLSAAGGIPPYTFSLAPGETLGPLTLSPNGSISGTPLSGGTITFTAQVTDAAGTTVSQSFSIVVAGVLVIDTPSLPSGVVGVRYSVGLHVTGGHPPYSWSVVAGSLPPGLNLNPATGGITGPPSTAGSYSFSVQVSSGGETSQPVAYSITITQTSGQGPSSKIIVITSPQDLPPATLGSAYTQQLTAVGGTGAYTWSVSSGSLPAGLTLGANGAFSGTPATAGSTTFSATVADTQGDQTTQQFTLLVVNPATATIITVSPLPDGVVGQTYNYGISITGGTPPYTWSIQQGTIPGGLSFDSSSGTFSGVPATTGTFSFVLTVTDSGTGGQQTSESKNYNIKVVGPADFHITTAPLLPGGTANVTYTTTFAATGGTRPYSWQLLSGSLPSGLTLDPNGTLAGSTTASGNFSLTIQAVDTNQVVATQWFVLSVGATNTPRIVVGGNLANGIAGTAYSQGLFATGGTTPYRWTVSAGSLPPGLSLDPTSGSISGTPTQKGAFGFTAHVADATGATASQAFTINVFANDLTITSTSPLPNASVNVAYTVGLTAMGGTPPYRWSLTAGGLAAGFSIDPATGAISGTPAQAGALNFTVLVTDQNFGRASQAFSLTVGTTQLTITSSPSLAGTVGVNFSSTLTATQGDPPYTWSVTAGTLPPGISLSASGTLSGTPTTAGTSHFTVQVTDTTSGKAQLAITFVVSAPSFAITTTSPLPAGTAGTPYSVTLQSAGGSGAITWSLASGTLPTGLSLASTGVLAGTPTLAEDSSFSVKATDSTGASVTASFQVHIVAPPVPTATFAGLPATVNPGDQPTITVQLPSPYPLPITITATLSITPNLSDNTDLLFANGSRTAQFTVPANAANFSFSFQAGTLAGQIQVGLTLQAAGKDVTPSPAPVLNTQILAAAPTIRIVSVTQITGGFQVVVDGISTPRDMKTANFQFTPATGANLQTTSATVDVTSFFAQWYQNPSSFTTGSQFALTVPFTISGNLSSIASVSVTMTNSVGTSAAVTAAVP